MLPVQSPSWSSGLRIWHCLSCGIGPRCSSDLISGCIHMGDFHMFVGVAKKGKKKSIGHKYMGLFLDANLYSIDLYVYPMPVPHCLDYLGPWNVFNSRNTCYENAKLCTTFMLAAKSCTQFLNQTL